MEREFVLLLACVAVVMDICEGSVSGGENMIMHRVKRQLGEMVNFTTSLSTPYEWNNLSEISVSNKIPFLYTIVVPEGAYNLSVYINTSIDSGDNIFSLCSVDVFAIGDNIVSNSSFSVTYMQTTSTVVSLFKNDSAVINFGTLQNNVYNNTADDQIEVIFEALVVNSSTFTDLSEYSVFATALLDNETALSTDVVNFTAKDTGNLFSAVPPLFNMTGPTTLVIGDLTNWTVTANLRDAVNKLQVEAWIDRGYNYSACSIFLTNMGANYPCLNSGSNVLTKTAKTVMLEIPTVINSGFNDNSTTLADDDITIDVLVKLPMFVDFSETFYLNIVAYLDDKLAWSAYEQVYPVYGSLPTTSEYASLQVGSLDGITTVAKGSGMVFTMDIIAAPGSISLYDITIEMGAATSCISSVYLMDTGDNLCMSTHLVRSYISSDGSGIMNKVLVDMDSVASMSPLDEPSVNTFRLEVAVCVPMNSTATIGSSIELSVSVVYEISKTLAETVNFTVVAEDDPSLATGDVSMTNSTSGVGNISSVVTVLQDVLIGQTREQFNITVEVPVINESALATLMDVQIVYIGSNFACINTSLSEIDSVNVSHTQKSRVTYSLGYVFNTGSTDRTSLMRSLTMNNTLTFEILLQILDHQSNTHNSQINVTTTLSGSSGVSTSGVSFVDVGVTGSEMPNLILDVEMEAFVSVKTAGLDSYETLNYLTQTAGKGNYRFAVHRNKPRESLSGGSGGETIACNDNVTFGVHIYHDINSTAHAQNVVVHCMTPYYMEFGELITTQDANITVDSSTSEYGIKLMISEIDFNDDVRFNFSVILDPARVMPLDSTDLETVVPFDMTYRGPIRGDRLNTGILHSNVVVLEFTFDTDSVDGIGMKTGLIHDCQITASSWLDTNTPSDARLDVGIGWKPAIRAAPFCGEEYIQINIGPTSLLSAIRLQSSTDDYTDLPTSFTLLYSDDGLNWIYIYNPYQLTPTNFTINTTSGTSVSDVYNVALIPHINTKHIRLVPQSASCLFGLRLELMGTLGSGSPVNCSNTSNTTSQLAERSYVVNTATGTIFVCGPTGVDGPIYCSRSDEAGDSWQEVDDTVANVVGTITNTSIVVGLSRDGISHVVSFDDGITWKVVSSAELSSYENQPGYISAIVFPNEDTRGQTFDSVYSVYGMDGYNFSLTGCTDGIAVKPTGGSWLTKAWWGTQEASTMT